MAWLLFAGLTGADEWLESLVGTSKTRDLEDRIAKLEKHLDEPSKKWVMFWSNNALQCPTLALRLQSNTRGPERTRTSMQDPKHEDISDPNSAAVFLAQKL